MTSVLEATLVEPEERAGAQVDEGPVLPT